MGKHDQGCVESFVPSEKHEVEEDPDEKQVPYVPKKLVMFASLARGQWFFVFLCLATAAAFVLSVSSVAYCDFARRDVQLTANASVRCGTAVSLGVSEVEVNRAACQVLSALNHSVGFFGFYAPLMPSTDNTTTSSFTCFSYSQVLKELNLDELIEYSTAFVASRAFAVLAPLWGGLALAGQLLVVCSCFSNATPRHCRRPLCWVPSASCLLAALCQGLSFLLLDSNLCRLVHYASSNMYTSATNESSYGNGTTTASSDNWVRSVSCRPSVGVRLACAAIVLYAAAAALSIGADPLTISSNPFVHPYEEEDDDDVEEDSPTVGEGVEKGPLVTTDGPAASNDNDPRMMEAEPTIIDGERSAR